MMTTENDLEFYEISAVSRLTGLSTHVLRIWEKRYGVVVPERTETGRRRYCREDIHRLTLLKSLVDAGHTISSVAKLGIGVLEERLSKIQETETERKGGEVHQGGRCRAGFVGIQARGAVRAAEDSSEGFSIVAEFPTMEEMVQNLKSGVLDVLIVEVGTLFLEDVRAIQKAIKDLSAMNAIVVYQFAGTDAFNQGTMDNVTALRGPVNSSEILLACGAVIQPSKGAAKREKVKIEVDETAVPPRLFTPEELQTIATEASVVKCECPRHLTNLLTGLAAFEEYSSRCENLNEDDERLHRFLHRETANCRLRMEKALQAVLRSEGIQI